MSKFEVSGATLHETKRNALNKAKKLRAEGWRVEVQPSSKTTMKRSPRLKWACFRGQKRKKTRAKKNIVSKHLHEKVMYGGVLVSRGAMIKDLQKLAKSRFPKDPQKQQGLVNIYLAGKSLAEKRRG